VLANEHAVQAAGEEAAAWNAVGEVELRGRPCAVSVYEPRRAWAGLAAVSQGERSPQHGPQPLDPAQGFEDATHLASAGRVGVGVSGCSRWRRTPNSLRVSPGSCVPPGWG